MYCLVFAGPDTYSSSYMYCHSTVFADWFFFMQFDLVIYSNYNSERFSKDGFSNQFLDRSDEFSRGVQSNRGIESAITRYSFQKNIVASKLSESSTCFQQIPFKCQ